MKRFLFTIIAILSSPLINADKSIFITHIINRSSSNFSIQDSNQIILANEIISLKNNPIDLLKQNLILIPDNKKNPSISIKQNKKSGIDQIKQNLASCIIQEKKQIPTKFPREIICRTGNNFIEIHDNDTLISSKEKKIFIKIFPEQLFEKKKNLTRYGDDTTIYQSPFSATGTCRKTETEILIPGFTQSGTICSETYESTNFPNKSATVDRPYLVYLPYEYFDDPNKLYPVLYHLHGTPSNPEETVDRVATLLDLLIADQRITPMIVVFPNGNAPVDQFMGVALASLPDFYKNSIVVDGNSVPSFWANSSELGNMETDIIFTLSDHIDATYQTKKDKQFRGINGFSGGGGAHQMVLPHSDRFGSVSSNSGYGLDWESEINIIDAYDEVYSQLLYDSTDPVYTNTHIADLDPFDEKNYLIVTKLPWLYCVANALAPNGASPYNAYLPIDIYGNIDTTVQTEYISHSAVKRAELYADDIKTNNLKIYFDAGALDFFYSVPGLIYPIYGQSYFLLDVNTTGASYYNGSANSYSDALSAQNIKHEFVAYRGNHNGQSNIQTMSSLLFHSAIFSSNYDSESERIKLIGNGYILMEENSSMTINQNTTIGIETNATYTTFTDFSWSLNDNAKLQLGHDGQRGGVLQIGNSYDKFDIEENPSLGDHTISFTLLLDGPGAEIKIDNHGILGFGAGVQGQEGEIPNQYVIQSLSSVSSININDTEGTIKHNRIIPGYSNNASLLAIGPCDAYNLIFDEFNSSILGGGNIVKTNDATLLHPSLSSGAFDQEVGDKIDFSSDHVDGNLSGKIKQGIREYQQTNDSIEVIYIVQEPVSLEGHAFDSLLVIPPLAMITYKSHSYLNNLNVNVLSSKPLLRDSNKTPLPENATIDQFFNFLKLDEYLTLLKKRAPIGQSNLNESTLVYINALDDLPDNDLIVRAKERGYPPVTAGVDDGLKIGAVGIILNRETPIKLIQVYDLEESW